MKPKFWYVAMLLVCMGLFTSAKQATCLCMSDIFCNKAQKVQPVKQKQVADKSFDLSPIRYFILSI